MPFSQNHTHSPYSNRANLPEKPKAGFSFTPNVKEDLDDTYNWFPTIDDVYKLDKFETIDTKISLWQDIENIELFSSNSFQTDINTHKRLFSSHDERIGLVAKKMEAMINNIKL